MAETIELEVVTPERPLVREAAESVEVPGKAGYLGILPGHAAFVGLLGTGVLGYVAAGGQRHCLAVSGGFIEVVDGHVRVLADVAEKAEEVDLERAREDLRRALEELARLDAALVEEATAARLGLERVAARIAAAERG